MANKKELYKRENEAFMVAKAAEDGVRTLDGGVLYEVISEGTGEGTVTPRSVVTCHYKGSLISGKTFDNSWERGCPEAFRVNELIAGFTTALCHMHKGDHWRVYIPWQQGYGKHNDPDIPGYSTLIFEIELITIQ